MPSLTVTRVNYKPRAAFVPHSSPLYALLHSQVLMMEMWLQLHRRKYFKTCQNPWLRTHFSKQPVWASWLRWIIEAFEGSPREACHGEGGAGDRSWMWIPSPPPPQTPAGPRILHVLRELSPGPTQEGWDGIRHRGAEDLRHHIYLWPWEARHEQIDYYSDTSGFKSQEQGLIIKTWEVQL